jgi:hypothetical protein
VGKKRETTAVQVRDTRTGVDKRDRKPDGHLYICPGPNKTGLCWTLSYSSSVCGTSFFSPSLPNPMDIKLTNFRAHSRHSLGRADHRILRAPRRSSRSLHAIPVSLCPFPFPPSFHVFGLKANI